MGNVRWTLGCAFICLCISLVCLSPRALANPAFDAGMAEYNKKNWKGAAVKFDEAFKKRTRPESALHARHLPSTTESY